MPSLFVSASWLEFLVHLQDGQMKRTVHQLRMTFIAHRSDISLSSTRRLSGESMPRGLTLCYVTLWLSLLQNCNHHQTTQSIIFAITIIDRLLISIECKR